MFQIHSAHIGFISVDCSARMEIESTEKVVRFLTGKTLEMEVRKEEYNKQNQLL